MTDKYEEILKNISKLPLQQFKMSISDKAFNTIVDAKGYTLIGENTSHFLNEDDVKYLCHAANHHQALVQALEWAQEYFKECGIGSHKVDDALAAAKEIDNE